MSFWAVCRCELASTVVTVCDLVLRIVRRKQKKPFRLDQNVLRTTPYDVHRNKRLYVCNLHNVSALLSLFQ